MGVLIFKKIIYVSPGKGGQGKASKGLIAPKSG